MSDRELLTECLEALTHDAAQRTFAGGVRMSQLAIKLRAHLAAPEPEKRHPGYILGSHWLETAYSRICAGEAEADVLRDCGWERVDDADALRRDAERLRGLLAEAQKAVWMNYDGDLLDRIEAALKEPAIQPAIRARRTPERVDDAASQSD